MISCERADASLFLAAFVVLRDPAAPAEVTSLSAILKHELRRAGSVVPSVIRFIDALPMSASGKTDTAKLREAIAAESVHQRECVMLGPFFSFL